jgi:hypothetical protein
MARAQPRKRLEFAGAVTGSTIIDPGTGNYLSISKIMVTCEVADKVDIFFDSETDTNSILAGRFAANGGAIFEWHKEREKPKGGVSEILKITNTGVGEVVVQIYYDIETR